MAYSLLSEPWIPVRPVGGGPVQLVGLRELLLNAAQSERIDDPSPLVTVALYRFCLAVLHRALNGPKDAQEAANWYKNGFPGEAIEQYLNIHAERFDLFHPTQPFMQVPDLTPELEGGKYLSHWTRLGSEVGSANTSFLFNPAGRPGGERTDAIAPAEAARRLLEHQTFALGGLIKRFTTSAKAAPVATLALTMPQGRDLHETLCLNLVAPYGGAGDLPAWERPKLKVSDFKALYDSKTDPSRVPGGLAEHYTWLSRAVNLLPETDERGETVVRFIGFAAGVPYQNTLDTTGKTLDPMVATVPMKSDPKRETPIPQKLRREQLFWRDVLALLPEPQNQPAIVENGKAAGKISVARGVSPASVFHARNVLKALEGATWQPPATGKLNLTALKTQAPELKVMAQPVVPISVFGQITDQGKAFSYRQEGYTLPHAFIKDPQRFTDQIFTVLEDAKTAGNGLRQAVRRLASETLSRGGEREAHKDDVSKLADQLPAEATFWARLEAPFRQYLTEVDASPQQARAHWRRAIVCTAWDAWALACTGVGEGAAELRAASIAERILAAALKSLLPNQDTVSQANTTPQEEPRDQPTTT